MTTEADRVMDESLAAAVADRSRARRRKIWLLATIGPLALLLIAGGIGTLIYVHHYQPLGNDGGLTAIPTPKTLKPISDGIDDTYNIVVGPTGTVAIADYSIVNHGHFDVRLLGLDSKTNYEHVTAVHWGAITYARQGLSAPPIGGLGQQRDFPVTLHPGDDVVLYVTVTEPKCYMRNHTTHIVDDVPIRWSALGVHHTWDFTMAAASDNRPIVLCPPDAALSRISRF